jgi:hypothetical protein
MHVEGNNIPSDVNSCFRRSCPRADIIPRRCLCIVSNWMIVLEATLQTKTLSVLGCKDEMREVKKKSMSEDPMAIFNIDTECFFRIDY